MLSERNTGILLFSTEQYKQIGEGGGGGGVREFGGGRISWVNEHGKYPPKLNY